MSKIPKLLFILTLLPLLQSCSTVDKDPSTAEEAFKIAQDYEKADRYQVAIQRYTDVKNKFPYSSLATEAELAIADVHYKSEDYSDAQISYQNFRELHPKHPKSDYVVFRTGLSYFQQLPETIDRDLTLATDAIYNFNELLKKYPESSYKAEAEEYRKKAYSMLTEKELYIADFYLKEKIYDSALLRYESALNKYSGFDYDSRILKGAIEASKELKNSEKEKQYTEMLLAKFPDSPEAQEIRKSGGTTE
ncbi:MAG: competence protein ComL [Pseudobdellovibrio sp.]|nr:competence protein ComL [Pseudobdellovibrio sp.]